MNEQRAAGTDPRLPRRAVIAALALHLAYSVWLMLGALVMARWGMAVAAESESGGTIAPYVFIAVHGVVTTALFAAALVSFTQRGRHYLLLATVAGVGGYLPLLGLSWYETGMLMFSGQFRSLAYFLSPMICLLIYRLMHGRRRAG